LCILKLVFDLYKAILTDSLAVEENDIVRISAENASGRILLKYDSLVVDKNFDGVFYVDIKRTADLDGKHDSAKLVNTAYYSGRLHLKNPPNLHILWFV
jgi:hypothetical protein